MSSEISSPSENPLPAPDAPPKRRGKEPANPQSAPAVDPVVKIPSPSVGRIVHYCVPGLTGPPKHRAAIISNVRKSYVVDLHVFVTPDDYDGHMHPGTFCFIERVTLDEGCAPGTWHWPEFVA